MINVQEETVVYLKKVRLDAKIDQKVVAQALNISAPQFYLYENNKRPVTITLFYNWCAALNKRPQDVLGRIYEKEHPRSHTSKAKRLATLRKKAYCDLTDEEKQFLLANS